MKRGCFKFEKSLMASHDRRRVIGLRAFLRELRPNFCYQNTFLEVWHPWRHLWRSNHRFSNQKVTFRSLSPNPRPEKPFLNDFFWMSVIIIPKLIIVHLLYPKTWIKPPFYTSGLLKEHTHTHTNSKRKKRLLNR